MSSRIVVLLSVFAFACSSSTSPEPSLEGDNTTPEGDAAGDVGGSDSSTIDVITACKPGQTWCQGNDVMQCRSDGKGLEKVTTCTAPSLCYQGGCCEPFCDDIECGDNQCGGVCGQCSAGRHCEAGLCQDGECDPGCEGRQCGPDACGGLCGTCPFGELCVMWVCMPPDSCVGVCDGKECGAIDECNCGNCAGDRLCVGHVCKNADEPCAQECENKVCGKVGECNCGECSDGQSCSEGKCVLAPDPCFEACAGKVCGQVGECLCGTCQEGNMCVDFGCVEDPCAPVCADIACGMSGECDCGGCDGGFTCQENACVPVTGPCVGFCAGKECGEVNGCQCGTCDAGEYCDPNNLCKCQPQCSGKLCGPDGCGGECGICDPGMVCTAAGLCFDPDCSIFEHQFEATTARMNTLAFGEDGFPGHGLDVDENGGTCKPNNKCSQGIDNEMGGSLSSVPGIGNPSDWLQNSLNDGKVHLLLELTGTAQDAWINFYAGGPVEAGCNFAAGACTYVVASNSFDGYSCQAALRLKGTRTETSFSVGGLDQSITIPLPLAAGVVVPLTLHRAHMKGSYTLDNGKFNITSGILAGAILKSEFVGVLNQIPDGILPISPDTIIGALDWVLTPDQDVNGDGTGDAYSVGFLYTATTAPITGVY